MKYTLFENKNLRNSDLTTSTKISVSKITSYTVVILTAMLTVNVLMVLFRFRDQLWAEVNLEVIVIKVSIECDDIFSSLSC